MVLNSANSSFDANITIISAAQDNFNIFQASNLPIDQMHITNFTVTDWQILNSTSQSPVIMEVSGSNNQELVKSYSLSNGQEGLSNTSPDTAQPLNLQNTLLIFAGITSTVLAVSILSVQLMKRKRRIKTGKENSTSQF
jgi:hypothetical protein